MDAEKVAEIVANGARYQRLTLDEHRPGRNHVYRVFDESGSRILKVYGTPARDRREAHALEALACCAGVARVLTRGIEEDTHWAILEDAGKWNLATLPENPGLARKAGEIMRTIHDTTPANLSNLSRGIDQEWVEVDFRSTFRRLERYRRKTGLSTELLSAAAAVPPPVASEPRASHTDPSPENFLVDDDGSVTLINWQWATLAPPEWDISKAAWRIGSSPGPVAAAAFMEGYGTTMRDPALDRWIVYHAGMALVFEAVSMRHAVPAAYENLVAELQRAVIGATAA